ncbi:MAG: enoyl-CoA hydratase-related protein [Pseudomonas sp.]|nr:enoyl-CoA hydratase-related protein [Pseudomonas sp.]
MTKTFADCGLILTTGPIATLTLNRPDRRNAMTNAMWQALPEICDHIQADASIRALILRGAGEKAFCAGADISEFESVYATPDATASYNAAVRLAQERLRELSCPTLAVISGACFGGGCGLALACDLRFANASARFAITPARLGLAYSPADTWQVIEKVGLSRAKDILFSGRVLTPEEALSYGLIDWLEADVEAAAQNYAASLVNLAPGAIRAIKTIANGLGQPAIDPLMQEIFNTTFSSAEFHEGTKAFLEKRAPNFNTYYDKESE